MNIDYKSYIIRLSPISENYDNFGVRGVVFLTENDEAPLYHSTFMNKFPVGPGEAGGTRSSRQSALKVVEKCKAWIDRRAELYTAIQKVVSEESCLG